MIWTLKDSLSGAEYTRLHTFVETASYSEIELKIVYQVLAHLHWCDKKIAEGDIIRLDADYQWRWRWTGMNAVTLYDKQAPQ